jgi:hypothetical protein
MWVTIKLFLAALGVLLIVGCGSGGDDSSTEDDVSVGASSELTPGDGAALVVNSTADADERDGELTLREAMALVTGQLSLDDLTEEEQANIEGSPGADSSDIITFDEEVFDPNDPATISLGSSLPTLEAGGDIIDGGGGVIIGGQPSFDCFLVLSAGNVIAGLRILGCRTAVILGAASANNTVGSYDGRQPNVLSGNYVGLEIRGSANAVQGNLIGTDASGTQADPNTAEGIWVAPGATDNLIGGGDPGARNVISGNALFGISIDGAGTTGNLVIGNYIGVDITGQVSLGNKYGITIQSGARDNVVGGKGAEEANVIASNNTGVLIRGAETTGNTVSGNYIAIYPWDGDWLENVRTIWITDGAEGNAVEENDRKVLPPPEED